ncbi:hypothetical protein GCM10011309_17400 [Litorimonas cladophorae]|uniref:VWFA domain-containing protein n=1 Tax=Litorimonas cladophorae TaxID=1220491 RepID=A0A918KLU8_9PROT|nr:vWA domain-containing protein [Litorimonas cladophorae]GGX68156.1 hypothetical protein GCM10011309_17400 [Litorimonas cladophorae]
MKRRSDRQIEVFSMSAIDLFAAAMGAFALIAIILLPYYQNELREKTPDNAIAELLRAAEESSVETEEKKKALEIKRSAMAQNVSDVKSEAQELLNKLRAAEQSLLEKQAAATPPPAVVVPEPIEEDPGPLPEPATVSFRFLGMNTTADDIVVALDMSRCMGGHEASVNKAVERVILSLQDNHAVKVLGFQQTDAGPRIRQWPANGRLRQINAGGTKTGAIDFAKGLTRQFGGSASMLDAFDKMLSGPGEAIFLISDGLPNPRANDGLSPNRLISEITRRNAGRKEIHAVVVGNYFDFRGTVEFMENLAAKNNGQFMALASTSAGVCD